MPILRVLKPNEQKRYEYPPIFDETTRKVYLSFTDDIKDPIKQLRTSSNKVFFLLLHGYFRASSRFYTPDRFYEKDIRYACHQLISIEPPNKKAAIFSNCSAGQLKEKTIMLHNLAYIVFGFLRKKKPFPQSYFSPH